MDDYYITYILGSVLNGFAQLAVVLGCVVLLMHRRRLDAILMLVGSALGIVMWLVIVLGGVFASRLGSMTYVNLQGFFQILGGLAYLIFAAGLVMLAFNMKQSNTRI